MHECQIKAPFRTICKFGHELWGSREEGEEEAVVEIGEEEDFTIGEGGEEGGLVDAVEGPWFEFAYSVCAGNSPQAHVYQ